MCPSYMYILYHFIDRIWASVRFGVWESPRNNPIWILRDSWLMWHLITHVDLYLYPDIKYRVALSPLRNSLQLTLYIHTFPLSPSICLPSYNSVLPASSLLLYLVLIAQNVKMIWILSICVCQCAEDLNSCLESSGSSFSPSCCVPHSAENEASRLPGNRRSFGVASVM